MSSTNPVQSSTNLFRRLAWQGSIPLSIRLADGEFGSGSNGDRYFIQAPRNTYLPLLIPEIRENLVEMVLDDEQLAKTEEKDWWFEEEDDEGEPGEIVFARQGACRWHWPIDLIETTSYISHPRPLPSSSSSSSTTLTKPRQLRLILHLSNPPNNTLLMSNSIENCKSQWVNQLKEGDFVRWKNTTRVTSLRRGDVDAGWDGVVQDDFDLHSRMANRILPLPLLAASTNTNTNTSSIPSRPSSTDPGGSSTRPESSYSARALPIKIYLPDGAPVVQEVIPPLSAGSKPTTLLNMLNQHLPLLFPNKSINDTSEPYPLAFPIAQGIAMPPESELAWLAACMCGADGWVRIGICIRSQ